MRTRTRTMAAAATIIGVLLLLWLAASNGVLPGATPPPGDGSPRPSSAARLQQRAAHPAPLPIAPAPAGESVREALDLLDLPGAARVRCPAGPLSDGLYEVTGPLLRDVRFVTVKGGELFAAVQTESGHATVAHALQPQAWLTWSDATEQWATCRVDAFESATVSGTVQFAGDVTSGHTVLGCKFGEVVDVDDQGRFTLAATIGSTCSLFVVREDGDEMGRGPVVEVAVDGDVTGITLKAPDDAQLWSPERQATIADQLVTMMEAGLNARRDRPRPELDVDADGELGALTQAWADQEQRRLDAMQDHIDRLDDPDERGAALLESFLGLY